MKPKIIITAANGFIGRKLADFLSANYDVTALVRKPERNPLPVKYVIWNGKDQGEWSKELEGAKAVINLAGKSVNCRYNEKNKAAIYRSRLDSTAAIGIAIANCHTKPEVWINAASATIYAHSEKRPNTEATGIIGDGFSVDVCRKWEACFESCAQPETRQIVLRTAIVLGKNGGVMKPFTNLVRFGLGGKMGKGNQVFSWIHEEDVCRALQFLIENPQTEGVYNLSSPNPVTNETFMKQLRKAMVMPFGIRQPEWLLRFGAKLIGTETELIFKSRYVIPEKLLAAGFTFRFENIDDCLKDLIHEEDDGTFALAAEDPKSGFWGDICYNFALLFTSVSFLILLTAWIWPLIIVSIPSGTLAFLLYLIGIRYDTSKSRYNVVIRGLILGFFLPVICFSAYLLNYVLTHP